MFNHSPQPNVMFTRVAPPASEPHQYPKLVFRTTKPIKKGDELYICYSADESKLWFSPDYKKEGDDVDDTADEPEWIAPMCDEEAEEQPAAKKNPVSTQDSADFSRSSATAVTPVGSTAPEKVTDETADQKYHDRKARKQSKREKKVKKPKSNGEDKQNGNDVVSEKPTDALISTDAPLALDATSSLSPSEYAAALAKLNLIPAIAVDDGDIEQEKVLDKASSSADQSEKDGAWSLVKRIRGPVEAQENDGERTGEPTDLCDVLSDSSPPSQSKYGQCR
jgi:tRNA-specific adenosine deaminase 3